MTGLNAQDLKTYTADQVASLADVDAHSVRDEGFRRQDAAYDRIKKLKAQLAKAEADLKENADRVGTLMTTYGIRIYADARDRVGCWLESFDPDEHEPGVPFPTGSVTVTTNPLRALRFVDKLDAFAFWQTQSSVTPLRPDGRANRPLTAFTVSIEPLEDTDGDQDDPEAQDDQGAEDQP